LDTLDGTLDYDGSANAVLPFSGVYPVDGTHTTESNIWTGNLNIDNLFDGLTIAYRLPQNVPSNTT